MIRWLLDTDHLSLHERGHTALGRRLAAVPPETVATSAVTLQEMLRGRLAVLSRDLPGELRAQGYQKLVDTVRFFNTIPLVTFDAACEEKFQELRKHRLRIGTLDLRIATVALVHDPARGRSVARQNVLDRAGSAGFQPARGRSPRMTL